MSLHPQSPQPHQDLYLIGGTWDLIFWNAVALANNTPLTGECVVFSRAFNPAQRQEIERVAGLIGLKAIAYEQPEEIPAKLQARPTGNVFLIHLSDPFTQRICKVLADRHLVIGFEGLSGYFPNPKVRPRLERPYSYVHYSSLPAPDWARPEYRSLVDGAHLRRSINALRPRLTQAQTISTDDNSVLLLGQHFHRHGVLTWEQEHSLYDEFIQAKIAEGRSIIWKEHPRNDVPFGPKFAEKYPGRFRVMEVDSLYSIEFWGEELSRLKLIAGVCSNSLFNLRDIFGLNATSILTPHTLERFNFNKLSKSSLINLIGIACLNHGNQLPIETFIAAFQKSAVSDTRKQVHKPGFFTRCFSRLKGRPVPSTSLS